MDIRYQDIIKLSDKKEYLVVSKVNFQDKDYIYLVDINDNTNMKFASIEKGFIAELNIKKDKELIEFLIPLFYNNNGQIIKKIIVFIAIIFLNKEFIIIVFYFFT